MKKGLIYAIIVVVVVGGILAISLIFPEWFGFLEKTNKKVVNTGPKIVNTTINTNKNQNTNQVSLNINAATGNLEVNKSVNYKDVTFNVLTADKLAELENMKASEGNQLVVLYIAKITEKTASEIFSWLKTDAQLQGGKSSYNLKSANLAGANSPDYAVSYLLFEASKEDSNFKLNLGAGESQQSIDLGF